MVIEDDRDMNALICEALEDAGYETVPAFDSAGGLKLMRESRPDLILLDVMLPDADGTRTSREINKDDSLKSIPIKAIGNPLLSLTLL